MRDKVQISFGVLGGILAVLFYCWGVYSAWDWIITTAQVSGELGELLKVILTIVSFLVFGGVAFFLLMVCAAAGFGAGYGLIALLWPKPKRKY